MKTLYYDVKCEVWHRTSFEVPDDTTLDVILKAIDSDLLKDFNVGSTFLYETSREILPQETNGATKELWEKETQSEKLLWTNQ